MAGSAISSIGINETPIEPTSDPRPIGPSNNKGSENSEFSPIDHIHRGPTMIRGLKCEWASNTTISISITSYLYKNFTLSLSVTWDTANGTALNGWDDDGANLNNSKSEHYIWLLVNTSTGALATVAAYDKTAPDITNVAFNGYEVVCLLTHFAVDGSGNIFKFNKVGNIFHYLNPSGDWGIPGYQIDGGSAVYTNPDAVDFSPAVPLIPEIENYVLNFKVNSASTRTIGLGLVDESLASSNNIIAICYYNTGTANKPIFYGIIPNIQSIFYAGDTNSAQRYFNVMECQYNNIICF